MKENSQDIKIWLNTPQTFPMQTLAVTKAVELFLNKIRLTIELS